MEDQDVLEEGTSPEEIEEVKLNPDAFYDIISFKGSSLPECYRGYVFSRWLRSLRYGNPLFKRVASDEYYAAYNKFIEILLHKPDIIVRLAVLSDDRDVVLGFSVSREDVLDYVFVSLDFRRRNIAKNLVPEGITTISHVTTRGITIWQEKFKHIKFNPFA